MKASTVGVATRATRSLPACAPRPRPVLVARVASAVDTLTTSAEAAPSIAPKNLEEAIQRAGDFNKAFSTSQYLEHAYFAEVEGELPKGLRGTLLRNGPGLFEVGGSQTRVPQPFDGDGMIVSIALDGEGNAHFANKFVRTSGFVSEMRAGRQLFKNAFNRTLPEGMGLELNLPFIGKVKVSNPLDMKIKDVANTNVLRWGGKTLALYERGLPHRMTPALETLSTDTLDDTLVDPFVAAHLRLVPEADGSSRAVMFSATEEGLDGRITCFEYDEQFKLLHRSQATFKGGAFGMYHDMAVTEHFYVFLENPLRMNMAKLFLETPIERASIAECLEFQETTSTKLHLIPRPGKGVTGGMRTYQIPGPGFFTFHHGNAYEVEADGSPAATGTGRPARYLVLDSCSSASVDFSLNSDNASTQYYGNPRSRVEPHRIVVDLAAPVGPQAVTRSCLALRSSEFPSVVPSKVGRPHRYLFLGASTVQGGNFFSPNQAIVKMEIDPLNGVGKPVDRAAIKQTSWEPPSPHHYPGEPVFVPRSLAAGAAQDDTPAEDDGWLMAMVFDAEKVRSYMVVVDASSMKEVAKVHLSHHVPAGLHGMFAPEYLGPALGTPAAQPYDIRKGV